VSSAQRLGKETDLFALLRIFGQILDHPRQQVRDTAEFFLSFDDAICADAPLCDQDIEATRKFQR